MKDFTKFHSDKEIAKYLISEFDNSKEKEIFSATKKINCRKITKKAIKSSIY